MLCSKTTFQKQKSGLLVREGLSGTLSTATPSQKKSSYQAASINTMVDKQVTSRSPTPRTKTRTQSARLTNTYKSHHDAICVWTWKAHRRSKRSMAAPLFSTRSPRKYLNKVIHIEDRVDTEARNRSSVAHIPLEKHDRGNERHADTRVQRYCELAGPQVPTCAQIVLTYFYLARTGRPYFWTVNMLARSVTRWNEACDTRWNPPQRVLFSWKQHSGPRTWIFSGRFCCQRFARFKTHYARCLVRTCLGDKHLFRFLGCARCKEPCATAVPNKN